MMPKTVSENLDLTLRYRSINLEGDPVNINGAPLVALWPRWITASSSVIANPGPGGTFFTDYTLGTGTQDTFTNGTPPLNTAQYILFGGNNLILPSAGYYTIMFRVNQNSAAGEVSTLLIGNTNSTGSHNIAIAELAVSATGIPILDAIHCTVSKYCEAGESFAPAYYSSLIGTPIQCIIYLTKLG